MDYDFRICKLCNYKECAPKYNLGDFSVYSCPKCYFHFINFLDDLNDSPNKPEEENNDLTDDVISYIEKELQHNTVKFIQQADFCERHHNNGVKTVLDIGCGGGAFLKLMEEKGYTVTGIEVNPVRRKYCENIGLDIVDKPIEDSYWKKDTSEFTTVTMWDVIEHVNFPKETVECIYPHIQEGGFLALDTPSRDALFYRLGEATYKLSSGKYPTFLKSMYGNHKFEHKQIFKDAHLRKMLMDSGFKDVRLHRKFELSFPTEFYLKKIFRNTSAAKYLAPIADAGVRFLRIRNKTIAIAFK